MSYWALSDGEDLKSDGSFESAGGSFVTIPEGSAVKAFIHSVKWQTKKDQSDEFLEVTWEIIDPEQFAKRRIFHKLWVEDLDPTAKDRDKAVKKRDNHRRMMGAIDANCGGKIIAMDKKARNEDFEKHWINKVMVISLGVYSLKNDDGSMNVGNWVRAIAPKTADVKITDVPVPSAGTSSLKREMDDSIPF